MNLERRKSSIGAPPTATRSDATSRWRATTPRSVSKRFEDRRCTEMISNVTCSIDHEVNPRQERPKTNADHWLSLAAAPTFAIMALLTGMHGGSTPEMLCSATQDPSPMTGMVSMYLLMSAFHSAPWLKLISRRGSSARWSSYRPIDADGRAGCRPVTEASNALAAVHPDGALWRV
jgi:hypothetical protein